MSSLKVSPISWFDMKIVWLWSLGYHLGFTKFASYFFFPLSTTQCNLKNPANYILFSTRGRCPFSPTRHSRLLLQVSTEACNPDDEMGMTFGCSLKDSRHLLESAKELGVQVVGVRWDLLESHPKQSRWSDLTAAAAHYWGNEVEKQ